MKAAIAMWRNPRMMVTTAVVAAIYAAAQITLNAFGFVIIPGVLGFKIADIFTMFFSVVFGPAGAFGVGFGNIIGDYFGGGLAIGSFFGFLSTFAIGYVGYTFWLRLRSDSSTTIHQVIVYLGAGVVSAAACAVILGWGLEVLRIAPFAIISNTIVVNFVIGSWVGGVFYMLLYPRLKSLGLTWTDVMDPQDIGKAHFAVLGAALIVAGAFGGWIFGAFFSSGMLIVGICFAVLILGALLV